MCFRLFTEAAFDSLEETTMPEILRVNLAQVVLQLKGMGVEDPLQFDFVTPPAKESLMAACKHLFALGGLDKHLQLTRIQTRAQNSQTINQQINQIAD